MMTGRRTRILFEDPTARRTTALVKALTDNTSVARFGLIKMRQTDPDGEMQEHPPVAVSDPQSADVHRARGRR